MTSSTSTSTSTDRIEKQVLLKAPRTRVWKTLTDAQQLGSLFGARLEGKVEPGAILRGPVKVEKYPGLMWWSQFEEVIPERLLSWRWHPAAVDPKVDYSSEPTTLVVFTLEETPGGTLVTVVESGFDALPAARRARAFDLNSQGWPQIMDVIRERHGTV